MYRGILFSQMFLGNVPTRARGEGAQFYVFAVVANFYLTVLLHGSHNNRVFKRTVCFLVMRS